MDAYLKLVQHLPSVWGKLYDISNHAEPDDLSQKLRRLIERINTRKLQQVLDEFQPDDIICTHFLPAELLSRKKNLGKLNSKIWVQVTDFDLHRMWVIPHIDGYFTANDEVKFRLQAHGVATERIHVTGIPIMPAFTQTPSKALARTELGLDLKQTVILLMGGGAGLGGLSKVAEQLLQHNPDFQLVVLTGRNQTALSDLLHVSKKYPERLFAQGFTDQVERIMAACDLIITKPGGLTSSECLAMGIPMIIHAPIPGQEEHNADFLLEQGVAFKAIDAMGLRYRVANLLDNPEQLKRMHILAKQLGKPQAAQAVLAHIQNT